MVPLSQHQKFQNQTLNFETYYVNLADETMAAGLFWAERHSLDLEAIV